jgi:hypothetical protein
MSVRNISSTTIGRKEECKTKKLQNRSSILNGSFSGKLLIQKKSSRKGEYLDDE